MSATARTRTAPLVWVAAAVVVVAVVLLAARPEASDRRRAAAPATGAVSPPVRAGDGLGVASRPAAVAGVGRIDAWVVDEDEAPVGGGSVVLSCLSAAGVVAPLAGGARSPDEDGHIEGPGCPGTVCIEYRHASHVAREPWTLTRDPDGAFASRTFVATVRPRLWGEVTGTDGEPVANATVTATVADADGVGRLPFVSPSTGTDAAGEFSFAADVAPVCDPCRARSACPDVPPPPSAITLWARAAGHGPAAVRIAGDATIGSDPAEPLTITLPPAAPAIVGTLVASDGKPWPRATVLARSVRRPAEQHRVDASRGSFSIPWLGEGGYHLRAIQDGVALAAASDVHAGDTVVLPPSEDATPRTLVLQLVADGRPRAGAIVRGGPFAQARTDSSGQVRAQRVVPGNYVVRVEIAAVDAPAEAGVSGRVSVALPAGDGVGAPEHRVVVDAAHLQVL